MDACGSGFDHGFDQLKGVKWTAEACFCICHDGREVLHLAVASFHVLDLVGADESVVDLLQNGGNTGHRVKALVGVHGEGVIGVACHLPAAEVNGFQACLHHFHCLVAGQCAQSADEFFFVQ